MQIPAKIHIEELLDILCKITEYAQKKTRTRVNLARVFLNLFFILLLALDLLQCFNQPLGYRDPALRAVFEDGDAFVGNQHANGYALQHAPGAGGNVHAVQTGRGIYMVQSVCICSHDIISHLSEAYQRFFEKKL